MNLAAVILAAGKGTRMKSKLPKVLHNLCGSPMLSYVLDAVTAAGVDQPVVVVGHGSDQVARQVAGLAQIALQSEQLGTAHALLQAGPFLQNLPGQLLVLGGDTPLIEADTLGCGSYRTDGRNGGSDRLRQSRAGAAGRGLQNR